MSDGKVAAVPEHLDAYLRTANGIAEELATRTRPLLEGLAALKADAVNDGVTFDAPDLDTAINGLVASLKVHAQELAHVAAAVRKADTTPFVVDAVAVDGLVIDKSRNDALDPELVKQLEAASPQVRRTILDQLDPVTAAKLLRDHPGLVLTTPPGNRPVDEGGGWDRTWHTTEPTKDDRYNEAKMQAFAKLAPMGGLPDAARHFDHYLSGHGEPLTLDVDHIAAIHSQFKTFSETQATEGAEAAAEKAAAEGRFDQPVAFEVPWSEYQFTPEDSRNLFLAISGAHVATTGTVVVRPGNPPRTEVTYHTHIIDRYNFDTGKVANPGTDGSNRNDRTEEFTNVPDDDMLSLHKSGLAHEFDMSGTSSRRTMTLP